MFFSRHNFNIDSNKFTLFFHFIFFLAIDWFLHSNVLITNNINNVKRFFCRFFVFFVFPSLFFLFYDEHHKHKHIQRFESFERINILHCRDQTMIKNDVFNENRRHFFIEASKIKKTKKKIIVIIVVVIVVVIIWVKNNNAKHKTFDSFWLQVFFLSFSQRSCQSHARFQRFEC